MIVLIFDVAIIGAGVVGGLIARELGFCDKSVVLIEKCNDVAMGATKANSAIVHGGFDAKPGTLKAKMNVVGTRMMPEITRALSVPFRKNGSLVVAFTDSEVETLKELLKRGEQNGVEGLSILGREELLEFEPNISPEAKGALLCASAGIVCPYELTIAAVENSRTNGVEFVRNFEVEKVYDDGTVFTLISGEKEIKAKTVINCAGVNSGRIAELFGDNSIRIQPRKGEYYVMDKSEGNKVSHTVFQCPGPLGKGILVTPTVDGNLLVGPTAKDIDDPFDTSTTSEGLASVMKYAVKSVPSVSSRTTITQFSGVRAHPVTDDFIIGVSAVNNRLVNVAGIESPGLSSAPAIARYVRDIVDGIIGLKEKADAVKTRKEPVRFRNMTAGERAELIKNNPSYGRIVCRCETITEGEILDAIRAPGGARDVDGVKRRTRAGMGRCQGGFCGSKVVEILSRELGIPMEEITKFGNNSNIVFERTNKGE